MSHCQWHTRHGGYGSRGGPCTQTRTPTRTTCTRKPGGFPVPAREHYIDVMMIGSNETEWNAVPEVRVGVCDM